MLLSEHLKNIHKKSFVYQMNSTAEDYYKFIVDLNSEIFTCEDYKEGMLSFSTAHPQDRRHFIHGADRYYTLLEKTEILPGIQSRQSGKPQPMPTPQVKIYFVLIENEEIDMNYEAKLYREAEDFQNFLKNFKSINMNGIIVQGTEYMISYDLFLNKYNAFYNIAQTIVDVQKNTFITIFTNDVNDGKEIKVYFKIIVNVPILIKEKGLENEMFKVGYAKYTKELMENPGMVPEIQYDILSGGEVVNKSLYQDESDMFILFSVEKIETGSVNVNLNNDKVN